MLCPPGLGDEVKALKAGILEIANAFIVNKADLPGEDHTERELLGMLAAGSSATLRPILRTAATSGQGIEELVRWLETRQAMWPDQGQEGTHGTAFRR